jgi:hypothetical protein
MARAGLIKLRLCTFDAAVIAQWAGNWTPTPSIWNLLRPEPEAVSEPQALAEKLSKFAGRKRHGNAYDEHVVELPTDLVKWLANRTHYSRGMFGHRPASTLPLSVRYFCTQSEMAIYYARRGRPKLHGTALLAALEKRHMCERHRKRLKTRSKRESLVAGPLLGETEKSHQFNVTDPAE